jgi:beta-N-acetylhexosaminidase
VRGVGLLVALAVLTLPACSGSAADEARPTVQRPESTSAARAADDRPASPPPAPARTSWGPTVEDWDAAGDLVSDMSTAEKAGAVIVAAYAGLDPPVDLVSELGLAGLILFSDNIPAGGADAIASLVTGLQESHRRPYPLVVAVDQEGGPVARLSPPVTEMPPAMALGAVDDPDLARRVSTSVGAELRALGVTMVFAPVADVTAGSEDPTIGVRSPGDDAALVARTVAAQVQGYAAAGVVPVLKHFPGHGSVPADSHLELPVQSAGLDELATRDLVPFRDAVRAGAPAVMVAHLDLRAVDPGVPSSLSVPLVSQVLRGDLGFEGLVVTDSLLMAAVADRYGPGEAAVQALRAGADLLLMPADPRLARDAVVAAVADGSLPAERLAEAAQRVVAVQLGSARVETPPLDVVGSSRPLAAELAARAVAVVDGPCEGPLVGPSVAVQGGTEQDRARFAAAAAAAGLGVGSGDVVALLGSPGARAAGDVVVALDAPQGLAGSAARTARVALFGRTDESFTALVDVLTGSVEATGALPVTVQGLPTRDCWHSG